MSNHPTSGARFLLELVRVDGARATYRAAIFTPDREFSTSAILAEDGTVEITPTGSEHDETLAMLAKLMARGAAKRLDDGLPTWPQRLLRWRGPGRGE